MINLSAAKIKDIGTIRVKAKGNSELLLIHVSLSAPYIK
jgi:hypothetical protein